MKARFESTDVRQWARVTKHDLQPRRYTHVRSPGRSSEFAKVGRLMQMQQIEYFLALCQELSFTRAARRCNISQPSLTNAIKALEVEMAGPLFSRKPQIGLTSLGRVMRPYFARIARDAENVRQMARLLTKVAPEGAKLHRRGPTQAIGLANGSSGGPTRSSSRR